MGPLACHSERKEPYLELSKGGVMVNEIRALQERNGRYRITSLYIT